MTTKFVGLKELRQHMARVSTEALDKKQRVIILKKNRPIFELLPLSAADVAVWKLTAELDEARRVARTEKTHSTKEVRAILGL